MSHPLAPNVTAMMQKHAGTITTQDELHSLTGKEFRMIQIHTAPQPTGDDASQPLTDAAEVAIDVETNEWWDIRAPLITEMDARREEATQDAVWQTDADEESARLAAMSPEEQTALYEQLRREAFEARDAARAAAAAGDGGQMNIQVSYPNEEQ